MGKIVKGPVEMLDSATFGAQMVRAEELFAVESDRLSSFLGLVDEPAVDNLPAPINLQGVSDQTIEEAEVLASQIVSDARNSAAELEADAHAKAEKIVQYARAEAQKLVHETQEAAENEAAAIREEAYQNAFQKGHEEGHEEGTQGGHDEGFVAGQKEGWDQGYKEGWEQGHHEYVDAINQLKKVANWIVEQRQQVVDQTESDLIGLVFDIVEKVVHHQIYNDHVIYHTARSMLEYTAGHERVLIRVNPDEIRVLEPYHDEFLTAIGEAVSLEIIEDPNVAPGGCLLETNLATIDAQVDTQLAKVRQTLMG